MVERRAFDQRVPSAIPGRSDGENLLQSQLAMLMLISVPVPPPHYRSSS